VSTPIDSARLRYELAIRGMSAINLAKKARLSPATVSAALAGKPIAEASLGLIAQVLEGTPESEFLKRLVRPIARANDDLDPPLAPAPAATALRSNDPSEVAAHVSGERAARELASSRRTHPPW
jgi:transcriptional regulator with XRE-family HTH domain